MKRIISIMIVLVLAVSLTFLGMSCKEEVSQAEDKTEEAAQEKEPVEEIIEEEPAEEISSEEDADEDIISGKRLGVALISKYDEWCAGVSDEFESQGAAYGFAEVNVQDGNLDHETQLKQVENFITKEYDMILIDAVNPEGMIETLEEADAKGIPVIAFDSKMVWDKLVSYIAWDHAQTGVLMGQYAKKYIEEELDGKANIAILDLKAYAHATIRAKKFMEQLEDMEGVNIVCDQDFQGPRETAANIILNTKEDLDIVFCVVDNGAWGAVSALEAEGAEGTIVLSAGGYGEEPFEALKNNHKYYKALVVPSPVNIVKDSLDIAVKYFNGEIDEISKSVEIELFLADSTNIGEIYN